MRKENLCEALRLAQHVNFCQNNLPFSSFKDKSEETHFAVSPCLWTLKRRLEAERIKQQARSLLWRQTASTLNCIFVMLQQKMRILESGFQSAGVRKSFAGIAHQHLSALTSAFSPFSNHCFSQSLSLSLFLRTATKKKKAGASTRPQIPHFHSRGRHQSSGCVDSQRLK